MNWWGHLHGNLHDVLEAECVDWLESFSILNYSTLSLQPFSFVVGTCGLGGGSGGGNHNLMVLSPGTSPGSYSEQIRKVLSWLWRGREKSN